jgi:hypothetical protein
VAPVQAVEPQQLGQHVVDASAASAVPTAPAVSVPDEAQPL